MYTLRIENEVGLTLDTYIHTYPPENYLNEVPSFPVIEDFRAHERVGLHEYVIRPGKEMARDAVRAQLVAIHTCIHTYRTKIKSVESIQRHVQGISNCNIQ